MNIRSMFCSNQRSKKNKDVPILLKLTNFYRRLRCSLFCCYSCCFFFFFFKQLYFCALLMDFSFVFILLKIFTTKLLLLSLSKSVKIVQKMEILSTFGFFFFFFAGIKFLKLTQPKNIISTFEHKNKILEICEVFCSWKFVRLK